MIFTLIFVVKCLQYDAIHNFSALLKTGFTSAAINRFRSHNGNHFPGQVIPLVLHRKRAKLLKSSKKKVTLVLYNEKYFFLFILINLQIEKIKIGKLVKLHSIILYKLLLLIYIFIQIFVFQFFSIFLLLQSYYVGLKKWFVFVFREVLYWCLDLTVWQVFFGYSN